MDDAIRLGDSIDAMVVRGMGGQEQMDLCGRFHAWCNDKDGNLLWDDEFDNLVVTVGKNYALDATLAASALSAVGPFMGLISSVGYSAIAAGDTMGSHAGWTEAGSTNAPTFAARLTTNGAWSAASAGSKSLSSARSFTMTGAGTLKGCFLVTGAGAVATLMDTNGTLFSAGLFSGGDRTVASTDVVNVSYTLSA